MLIFLFPGQSSADPLMIVRGLRLHDAAAEVAERARALLGSDGDRYLTSAGVRLECNRDVQISVFIATQMHLASLAAEGLDAVVSAGLSLGEYSHLVHIGAVTFENALELVVTRGTLYDQSPPGCMVTILGADQAEVEEAVALGRANGVVVVSNYNTPTQHVIAGEAAPVRRAVEALEEGGAQAVTIENRVAMHSPLLDRTATEYARALCAASWGTPRRPYLPNVHGAVVDAASPEVFHTALTTHVNHPVQWRRTIEGLARSHPHATFVEVGPGAVVHNMLSPRWVQVDRARSDEKASDAQVHFRSLVGNLRARA